jgi:urate oxidase
VSYHLGPNQYGKAEVRLVTVTRDGDTHHLRDLTVTTTLRGDLAATHLTGDNSAVVATDTQKNTIYAFAKQAPVGALEDFALRLGRHFVDSFDQIHEARITIEEHGWERIHVDRHPHHHAFARGSTERRTATVTVSADQHWVVAGLTDLVVLKTTGSEFHGYPKDSYTTLPETTDRVLATSVTAQWRYAEAVEWDHTFLEARKVMLETFAEKHSLSLQQTLYAMGSSVLEAQPSVAEIRLSMPNKHHLLVDLSPFGLENNNEVFYAADRPYGLIEGTVIRDDAPDPGPAWQ